MYGTLKGRHIETLRSISKNPINEITEKLFGDLLLIFGLFIIYCITSIDRYLYSIDGNNCIG